MRLVPNFEGTESRNKNIDSNIAAVAIIGISCRFPNANSPEEFWEVLANGIDCITPYPKGRPPPIDQHENKLSEEQFMAGFLKCPIDEFDANFFGISNKEAPFMDPQQRILMEVTWEAMEDAGIKPESLHGSNTAVYTGIWQAEYDSLFSTGLSAMETHYRYTGNAYSATASRMSYFLGLNGPNLAVESGCASALAALHLGCVSLLSGASSLVLASGVNIILKANGPLGEVGRSAVLSPTCRCKTFDEDADGFVPAEGCGVLVLKRYADALRDGDNIYALIRGSAVTNDGAGPSFGTPNPIAQEQAIREALANASVLPSMVSYVEAHGTGTPVGDPTEMKAIEAVYAEDRKNPLYVGSVKTNIGHTEGCSGIAGLIKVILCMKNNTFPPNLHFKTLNSKIDLEKIPAKIPLVVTEWKDVRKIAGVSSFGMSGTNVHVILEKFRNLGNNATTAVNQPQMISISAKSEPALKELITKYAKFLEANPLLPLESLAYATNVCRATFPHRASFVVNSTQDLISKLENFEYQLPPPEKPTIAFLFTGQGSQYVGMTKSLYAHSAVFQEAFDKCSYFYKTHLGCSIQEVLENELLINKTVFCQPAIFCIQYSIVQLLDSFGIRPNIVLGHSVGEFCAAVCAGVLTFDDAFSLVCERSKLVGKLNEGRMLAVKSPLEVVVTAIREFQDNNAGNWIDIAADNSDAEVVVSGNIESIDKFESYCSSIGIKTIRINATHAFHSRAMDPMLDEFGNFASTIPHKTPEITYISSTEGNVWRIFGSKYWQNHVRNRVNFASAVKLLANVQCFVEIGPQPTLLALAMDCLGSNASEAKFCPTLGKKDPDVSCILQALSALYNSGVNLDWSKWFGPMRKDLVTVLPKYPFQRQKFWYTPSSSRSQVLTLSETRLNKTKIHPILGIIQYSPTGASFYNNLNISAPLLQYISDHSVAGAVVLPGASFLEAIAAAGTYIVSGKILDMCCVVEHFEVHAALDLERSPNLQTIVTRSSNTEMDSYKINIFSEPNQNTFTLHACAVFRTEALQRQQINLEKLKTTGKHHNGKEIEQFYADLAKVGIKCETNFQSIGAAWTTTSEEVMLCELRLPKNKAPYACHPIILDAMFQTYVLSQKLLNPEIQLKLQVPVGVKKFSWFAQHSTEKLFVTTEILSDQENVIVTLANEEGDVLAKMEGVEVVETNQDKFLAALRNEEIKLPMMWQEVWKTTKREQREFSLGKVDPRPFIHEALQEIASHEDIFAEAIELLGEACKWSLLRTIRECKWSDASEIKNSKLFSKKELKTAFALYCVQTLEEMGYLKCVGRDWEWIKPLPSVEKASEEIQLLINNAANLIGKNAFEIGYITRLCNNFTSILQGKLSAQEFHFPITTKLPGARQFYENGKIITDGTVVATACMLERVVATQCHDTLRILEVGAGTGSATVFVLEKLTQLGINFEYTFTDISTLFLSEAKNRFGEVHQYELLNIDEDPLSQNFAPESFDIILGFQVLHLSSILVRTLSNLNALLRPGGCLVFSEQIKDIKLMSLSFGLLEGWWGFNDDRKLGPMCNLPSWENRLTQTGFEPKLSLSILGGNVGIVAAEKLRYVAQPRDVTELRNYWLAIDDDSTLSKLLVKSIELYGREVLDLKLETLTAEKFSEVFEYLESENLKLEGVLFCFTTEAIGPMAQVQEQICGGLLHLCQGVVRYREHTSICPRIVALTRGVYLIGDSVVGQPHGATMWGLLKSFISEYPKIPVLIIDTDPIPSKELEVSLIFEEIWTMEKSKESFIALRNGSRHVQRFIYFDIPEEGIVLPQTSRYSLVQPKTKLIDDIQIQASSKLEVGDDQVEVSVEAVGLNFIDIFLIQHPGNFLSSSELTLAGIDVAGTVVSVGRNVRKHNIGDAVFGCTVFGGLRSHIAVREHTMFPIPEGCNFTAAASIPCAFLTAYYCLILIAKLSSHDRILIHTASGGVGLAAIQIANNIGAKIYVTAGTRVKRTYLRSLGITNVYDSRSTNFGVEILKDTDGSGVTVVLNSLTQLGYKEASLSACAGGAHFIEIGKQNVWHAKDVAKLRPDVQYCLFDINYLYHHKSQEVSEVLKTLAAAFNSGQYKPLPCTIFPLDLVRQAFHYFQSANHIGKIIIKMPKFNKTFHHNLFDNLSTYIITGGLGGLGLKVTEWMTTSGATHLVLVGRSKAHASAQSLIDTLNSTGSCIITYEVDVSDYEACQKLLSEIRRTLPPIRGIFHAAGDVSDAVIPNQSLKGLTAALEPKVIGGGNLHQLSLQDPLEYFVLFSSMACILGTPSQSNYSAANCFLDALAQYRNSIGLCATIINWGPWAEVGTAANLKIAPGITSFLPSQGVASLNFILRNNICRIGVMNAKNSCFDQFSQGNYFLEILHKVDDTQTKKTKAELIEDIKTCGITDKQECICIYLEHILREILDLPSTQSLDTNQHFAELGVDSLMNMKLRNSLQQILADQTLTANALQEHRTIQSLSTYMANLIQTSNDALEPTKKLQDLVHQDCHLDETILPAHFAELKPSQLRHVLLTGATGHLGTHFLAEMVQRGIRITCLLRQNSAVDPENRLRDALSKFKLSVDGNLYSVIVGDVSKDKFGLDRTTYETLAIEIDAIVNCAVNSNHVENYEPLSELRTSNVIGLKNVFEFAAAGKTKAILHASSLIAASELTEDGQLVEDFPAAENFGSELLHGYTLSKFICEKLLDEAAKRGFPVTIFRYPMLCGNSITGEMSVEENHGWKLLVSCMRMRSFSKMGKNKGIPVAPVDTAARVSTKIFFDDASERGVYNFNSGDLVTSSVLKEVTMQVGMECKFVGFKTWRNTIFNNNADTEISPLLYLYEDTYSKTGEILGPRFQNSSPILQNWRNVNLDIMSPKLSRNCLHLDHELVPIGIILKRHLEYIIKTQNQ